MPRRKSEADRFLDDVFDFLCVMPWWIGPPVILVTWVMFAFVIPMILSITGGGDDVSSTVHTTIAPVCVMLAPFIALVVAMIWLFTLIRKWQDAHRLDSQTGIDSIRHLSWREFEQLLAEAYRRQGYVVQETGPGADGGVDLILTRNGTRTLVQAKQWKSHRVGVRTVRELFGVQHAQQADGAILITSGQFTPEAQVFARSNDIQIVDGEGLVKLINDVQGQKKPAQARDRGEPDNKESKSIGSTETEPSCPKCGAGMIQRAARRGPKAGQRFWGCSAYPACRGTRALETG